MIVGLSLVCMANYTIPSGVREWIEFGLDPSIATIRTKQVSEVEGASIITGTVGNTLDATVREFVEEHSETEYLIVEDFDNQDEWGSLALNFSNRDEAEEFLSLARGCDAGLRLSSGKENGWFLYEAE